MKGAMCSSFCKAPNTTISKESAKKRSARQIVQNTDKICQEDFLKWKSIKISKKTMLKQIGSSTDKIISKSFSNYLY